MTGEQSPPGGRRVDDEDAREPAVTDPPGPDLAPAKPGYEDRLVARLEAELSPEERAFLDDLADGIASRRLTPAALFFFESVKPLGYVASQVLHFFRPMVSVVWTNPHKYDQLARILERRGSLELLLRRLEARA